MFLCMLYPLLLFKEIVIYMVHEGSCIKSVECSLS